MGRKPKNNSKAEESFKPAKGKKEISRLRGMRDILPEEFRYFDFITKKAESILSYYGFLHTDIPVLEQLALYERSTGKQTDIVTKEMYNFIDRDGDKVALRPEATPSLVRSYIEHGLFNWPNQPVKVFWYGPLFRRERPQAGRYRQFSQIDVEMFGEASPVADAQVIVLGYLMLKELGVRASVQINSIGDPADREEYSKKLVDYFKDRKVRALLSEEDKKRLQKNPLRVLDSKEEGTQKALEEAPQIIDHISDAAREHFIKVLEYLDEFDVPYTLNPLLVRGLDYYNRTVFEFWPAALNDQALPSKPVLENSAASGATEEGETDAATLPEALPAQSALGGGGRYDGLVEFMGGRPTPACGFALGIDRIVVRMKEQGIKPAGDQSVDIFVAQLGEGAKRKAMILFEQLRQRGYRAAQNFVKDNLKVQLEQAHKLNVKLAVIIGQKELMDGTVLIRDMESGMQEVFAAGRVFDELDKRLKSKEEMAAAPQPQDSAAEGVQPLQ